MTQRTYKTKLDEYLGRRGAAKQLQYATGLNRSVITKLRHGDHPGTLAYGALIEEATKGEVKAEDICTTNKDLRMLAVLRGKAQ